ncbi:MAG: hypothetical protein R3F61_12405 [Myxococcota bacterium]
MKRWVKIDSERVPGAGTLELLQGGDDFVIQVDGVPLMSNREHGSEDALADLACEHLPADASILVGGLGMGFTTARALARLGPAGRVVVAELVPAVVRWNRGPAGSAAGHVLDDPRTELFEGDVADAIRSRPGVLDAVLLDVDNGPEALSHPGNRWLYGPGGLSACWKALRPGGVLGVWSVAPDPAFTARMERAGFAVTVVPVRSRGKKGNRHVIWVGRRPR